MASMMCEPQGIEELGLGDGGRDDDHVGAAQVGRVVADVDRRARGAQRERQLRLADVGPVTRCPRAKKAKATPETPMPMRW
jgi:hypothetical protein